MKGLLKSTLCGSIMLLTSAAAQAGLFEISIDSVGGLTTSQEAIFDNATAFWESHLIGVQENFDLNLVIEASGPAIDGPGQILGQAGPTYVGSAEGIFLYATEGIMQFDSADLAMLEDAGALFDVILHEMAHVIGFGTLWNPEIYGILGFQSLYNEGTGQYTGEHALSMFQEEFDSEATFVPVELDGGPGTANGHWDESWLGGPWDTELMTGYLDFPTTLSNTTLASFADLGYIVQLDDGRIIGGPTPVPTPATLFLFISALLILARKNSLNSFKL